MNSAPKIAVVGTFPPSRITGGRLHAVLLAAALARVGCEVNFLCNRLPGFLGLLPDIPGLLSVSFLKLRHQAFRGPDAIKFDHIIIVQERSVNFRFFEPAFEAAEFQRIPISFLTFESPNWQQAQCSDIYVENSVDFQFFECEKLSANILTSSDLGAKWAAMQFPNLDRRRIFKVAPPELSMFYPGVFQATSKSITCILTPRARHKGCDTIKRLLTKRLSGVEFNFLVGGSSQVVSFDFIRYVESKCLESGIKSKFYFEVTESQKFHIFRNSRVLAFPSKFEGFGLPPAEAISVGTRVVAYDLPLFRELFGEAVVYAKPNDPEDFCRKVEAQLTEPFLLPEGSVLEGFRTYEEFVSDVEDFCSKAVRVAPRWLSTFSSSSIMAQEGRGNENLSVILFDTTHGWESEEAISAFSSHKEIPVRTIKFDIDYEMMLALARQAGGLTSLEIPFWSGDNAFDLRSRLLSEVRNINTPYIFLTDDAVVCNRFVIDTALAEMQGAKAKALGVPLVYCYQHNDTRAYLAQDGAPVFQALLICKDTAVELLEKSLLTGCAAQPIVDFSYLLAMNGIKTHFSKAVGKFLPTRPQIFSPALPSGEGTWQREYFISTSITELIGAFAHRQDNDRVSLTLLIELRKMQFAVVENHLDEAVDDRLIQNMLQILQSIESNWRAITSSSRPDLLVNALRDPSGFYRFGRHFLSYGHLLLFGDYLIKQRWGSFYTDELHVRYIDSFRFFR